MLLIKSRSSLVRFNNLEDSMEAKKILVLYHADCSDGFGAAYAAWKKFGDNADYLPILYKTEPPPVVGKNVYLLDYGYPKDITARIAEQAEKFIMIDHHVTNEETVKMANEYIFDISHSASVLAWGYFHPDVPVPKLLLYVEDKDLWKFSLPFSKEVSRWFANLQPDFGVWDGAIKDFEDEKLRDAFIAEGSRILAQVNRVIDDLVSRAKEVVFEGYKTLIIETAVFHSEVGNALAKKLPPIGIVWVEKNGKYSVSLRSDGTVDVAKLAEKYGGGGHKSAAGFVLDSRQELEALFKLK